MRVRRGRFHSGRMRSPPIRGRSSTRRPSSRSRAIPCPSMRRKWTLPIPPGAGSTGSPRHDTESGLRGGLVHHMQASRGGGAVPCLRSRCATERRRAPPRAAGGASPSRFALGACARCGRRNQRRRLRARGSDNCFKVAVSSVSPRRACRASSTASSSSKTEASAHNAADRANPLPQPGNRAAITGSTLRAEIVAIVLHIRVALVFHPREAHLPRVSLDPRPRHRQERSQDRERLGPVPPFCCLPPFRHGRHAARTCPTQNLQKNRFRLVVQMMRKGKHARNVVAESRIARSARREFQTAAAQPIHLYRDDAKRDAASPRRDRRRTAPTMPRGGSGHG